MARILPDGWEALDFSGSALREIETLRMLAGLPDDFTVLHGVHWTRIEHGCSVYGEIDFIVVAPNGRVLLIEQKSGFLEETPDGLIKVYGSLKKKVASQIMRSIDGLLTRFSQSRRAKTHAPGDRAVGTPALRLAIDYLLFCPDYKIRDADRAGLSPERIVDASRAPQLVAIVVDLLGPEPPAGSVDAATALRFFSDELLLVADVGTLIGRTDAWVTRLAGGLAEWATRLEFSPFRLRVRGTAGSGKTQLALRVLADAVDEGRSALYLCYNRPLADHIARIAPAGVTNTITTFHGFGDRLLRASGIDPDFNAKESYAQLEAAVVDARPTDSELFDVVIVDEGQDFTAEWRDAALRFLRPSGKAYWLEDPMQNLYGREPVALDGWVTLHTQSNYRSPRDIIDAIVPLLASGLTGEASSDMLAVKAASPLSGSELDITTWANDDAAADGGGGSNSSTRPLIDVTMRAITKALAAGYRRSDIAVLTFAGREHSKLLALDELGPHALRRFAGAYDLFGNPVYTSGEVLAETIYRFKGQSAPCVIFTEIDFEALDQKTVRKLFVGATRATTRLMLIMSERAARICLADGSHAE